METLLCLFVYKQLTDRGFLTLPICPIYGISIVICFLIFKVPGYGFMDSLYNKYQVNNNKTLLISIYAVYMFLIALFCGSVEYLTGFLIDKIDAKQLWSYDGCVDSISGYIRLSFVILFGIFGALYLRFVVFYLNNKILKSKSKVLTIFAFILPFITIIDFLISMKIFK